MRAHRLNPADRPRRHASGGFTLLETLVAIVVLSFGVLGMVGMQALALQANREARYQTLAVQLAKELADMMRNNSRVALLTTASLNPYLITATFGDGQPAAVKNCFTGLCTQATDAASQFFDIANWESGEWLLRVYAALPSARVVVCADVAPYDSAGLPQWTCTGGSGAPMVIKIGWTRLGTDRGTSTTTTTQGLLQAVRPSVMVPLTPASTT